MATIDIAKRRKVIKWFLLLALIPLVILLLGSAPALIAATNHLVPRSVTDRMVFTVMFFVPLAGIFLMMPLIRELKKSLLLWGIAIVCLPLGTFFSGARLLYITRNMDGAQQGVQADVHEKP